MPTRASVGTISRMSWNRLALRSGSWRLIPVAFPWGRARLATRPDFVGSETIVITIGDRAGGLLQGQSRGRGFDGDDVNLETDQLARQGKQSIRTTVGITILDDDVLTFAVAKIPEALPKPLAPERDIAGREGCEKSYARNLPVYSARPESWARREESPAHKTRRKKEKRRREGGGQA